MSFIGKGYNKLLRKILKPVFREIQVISDQLKSQNERINAIEKNILRNSADIDQLKSTSVALRLENLESNMRQNNQRLNEVEGTGNAIRMKNIEDNIHKNNQRLNDLEKMDSKIEMNLIKLKTSVDSVQNGKATVGEFPANPESGNCAVKKDTVVTQDGHANAYSKIDYFDFENHFRGSCQNIKDRQRMYLPYFENCKKVLDLGCGRGEFLELLSENGIAAKGVDLYDEYVEYCRMNNLDAVNGDAISYLADSEAVDGIMAAQLVEHLETDQVVSLCETAYEKLSEGGILIMESPNPKSLAIYTNEFYMDPSHVKPVHPETLKYFAEKAGFASVDIIYTESSKISKEIPILEAEGLGNLEKFNESMQDVAGLLYGSRDYAVIARK